MNRRSFLVGGAAVGAAALAGCLAPFDISYASYGSSTAVSPGTVLRIDNRNGSVRLYRRDGTHVRVDAEMRSRGGNAHISRVSIDSFVESTLSDPDRMIVQSVYEPFADGSLPRVAVDMEVGVPDFVVVERVTTENGNVRVRGTARLTEASTKNGNVDVEMAELPGDATFTTSNGNVVVRVPADLDATVSLRTTNGNAEVVDLPVVRTRDERTRIEGTLGSGGPRIDLRNTNGNVVLRRA